MARLVVLQVIAGIIGGFIAARKGRSFFLWFAACFIFPLLTIVVLALPSLKTGSSGKQCPSCSRTIGPDEHACRYCNREMPIELVPCSRCGSYIPSQEKCPACDKPK